MWKCGSWALAVSWTHSSGYVEWQWGALWADLVPLHWSTACKNPYGAVIRTIKTEYCSSQQVQYQRTSENGQYLSQLCNLLEPPCEKTDLVYTAIITPGGEKRLLGTLIKSAHWKTLPLTQYIWVMPFPAFAEWRMRVPLLEQQPPSVAANSNPDTTAVPVASGFPLRLFLTLWKKQFSFSSSILI